ncbi:MAG: hypothetical protein A2315_17125 [Ignavibacteria bacterium RIFOXYB2_FULL_35_12]|nr:MAG: hypothetical protein A2X60_16110 [Ignavibacteria bacterium GWF2_35_20]OGU85772.1 MAG: hypothetical protein A3K31_00790 [Ignavibacteria bacterium RIFOXYA12_FULL_35_25]OGU93145.1 MAG: hypothetical protein A2347_08080 [Ignavibacteria bacterium RIFOXYB12_FULL_35_14]OGU98301.1 MAG: hypothetical protein A2455_15805 [Ignavibacteria bacterium RIFOXYC2_FULL_35_16]OGV03341.1 MAG: hypothetical protein A2315_17125 [Ignavibacteria bacterium RIFOXYB2_FULL_35_12]OGV31074.1 MAG: hypothetical protein A
MKISKRISNNNIKIKKYLLVNVNIQEYLTFILNNNGLVFHEPFFNEVVKTQFKLPFFYYAAYLENELIGFCPVYQLSNKLILKTFELKPLYDVPYGGWIYNENLISHSELIKKLPEGIFNKIVYYSKPIVNENISPEFTCHNTVLIDLLENEANIWERSINSKRRNMIRKAWKNNIIVKKYIDLSGLTILWPILESIHKKLGYHVLNNIKYYQQLLNYYFTKKQAIVLIAFQNTVPISGIILIGNKNMMHYWKGASLFGHPKLGQGELLQWEAIKWAKSVGSRYYDLCVVEKENLPEIYNFKTGFSKHLIPYYLFSKSSLIFKILNKFL